MKNTMMVSAVLFVMAFAGGVMAENSRADNLPTRAIFAAPCPGETGLWCVAVKNEGPIESQMGYGFEKRPDGSFQFVDRANVKTETVKAIFLPKNLVKNWDITPSEAILAVYNGRMFPEKTESDLNWFMLHETTVKLTMWKNASGDELTFMEVVKKESSVAWSAIWMFCVLVMLGAFLGTFAKKYWYALLFSLFPIGFFSMILTFKINTLDDIYKHIDLIIMFVLSTPIVAMLVRPLRAWMMRKAQKKQ